MRIKNWASCVPEEVRKNTEWMPIEPFERHVWPRRVPGPFFVADGEDRKRKMEAMGSVPGGIGEQVEKEKGEGEKVEAGTARKRPKRNAASSTPAPTAVTVAPVAKPQVQAQPYTLPNQPQAQTPAPAQAQYAYTAQQQQYMMQHRVQDRSLTTGAGLTAYASTMVTEKLPPETSMSY